LEKKGTGKKYRGPGQGRQREKKVKREIGIGGSSEKIPSRAFKVQKEENVKQKGKKMGGLKVAGLERGNKF